MEGLAAPFLGGLATLARAPATVLSLKKTTLPIPTFFQSGLTPEAVPIVAEACAKRLLAAVPEAPGALEVPPHGQAWLSCYPIPRKSTTVGILGVLKETPVPDAGVIKRALSFFACALNKQIDELEHQRQISNLNTY